MRSLHLSVRKLTRQAEMHTVKTQYLYIFTAAKKCGSTSRFGIIFDSHAVICLLVSSVQKSVRQSRCMSSVSEAEMHTLAWWVCQVLQTNGNQTILL